MSELSEPIEQQDARSAEAGDGGGVARGTRKVRAWLTRDDLSGSARSVTGLLSVSPDATTVVPAAPAASFVAALRAAGVGPSDRVVVALSNDGEGAGTGWAQAAAEIAAAAATVGPRGRLRLHRVVETVGATTLVITPTGAMDLLARLHLEFLLDPLDLGLRTIVLTGEIGRASCRERVSYHV